MKKITLLSLVTFLTLFLFNSQPSFAQSVNTVDDSSVDLNSSSYIIVTEEEVIEDYMEKENVDRETAKRALGITDSNAKNQLAACTTQWRYYTAPKKKIMTGLSITLSPYVQVQTCNGTEKFLSVSSAQPGYSFSGIFAPGAKVTTANAIKTSSTRVDVHASGTYKDLVTRYWNTSTCIAGKVSGGSRGCF